MERVQKKTNKKSKSKSWKNIDQCGEQSAGSKTHRTNSTVAQPNQATKSTGQTNQHTSGTQTQLGCKRAQTGSQRKIPHASAQIHGQHAVAA